MQAVVDAKAEVGLNVSFGPGVVISAGAQIGDGCIFGAFVFVDDGVVIGPNCHFESHCVILRGTKIGQGCQFMSGVVVGSQGFGFVEHQGTHHAIPQVGGVEIGDDTWIGANSCVDRGTLKPTRIGNRCRIGAQVQLAHNTAVGDDSTMGDQAGLAGSTYIGQRCHTGPQSGIAAPAMMGDDCQLGFRAGLTRKAPNGSEMWGFPARPRHEAMRNAAALSILAKKFAKEDPTSGKSEA